MKSDCTEDLFCDCWEVCSCWELVLKNLQILTCSSFLWTIYFIKGRLKTWGSSPRPSSPAFNLLPKFPQTPTVYASGKRLEILILLLLVPPLPRPTVSAILKHLLKRDIFTHNPYRWPSFGVQNLVLFEISINWFAPGERPKLQPMLKDSNVHPITSQESFCVSILLFKAFSRLFPW